MQHAIDVVEFVEGVRAFPEDERAEFAPTFEAVLSRRTSTWHFRAREFRCLEETVDGYLAHDGDAADLAGMAYSYTIPHISKEVDLLKVGKDAVLDVELKCAGVSREAVCRQLRQNAHYLGFLGMRVIALTHVASRAGADAGVWYELVGDDVREVGWERVVELVSSVGEGSTCDLDTLFRPASYLVSPVLDFERFSRGEYILSDQQQEIANMVLAYLGQERSGGLVVQGDAGTGKSLLLFDVAMTYAREVGRRAAIFHGASLGAAHEAFNDRCEEIEIVHPRRLGEVDPAGYSFVGFDEAHRMYPTQFRRQLERALATDTPFLVALDPKQEMSKAEVANDIAGIAREMVSEERILTLSKRFRANDQIVGFVEGLVRGKGRGPRCADRVSVVFAADEERAREQVRRFQERGYHYIWTTTSRYRPSPLDELALEGAPSTHQVIGLEYDKVVMVASLVCLEGGRLRDLEHPDPNLLPTRLLYQGLTRAREAIALVVLGDRHVFRRAVTLLGDGRAHPARSRPRKAGKGRRKA